ncbi:acyltransferase domain-containing protein [Ditylenchus destructor]|uniref:Acyltransferase domain-containing protein n=1 Tax=Ditylenchus destructor TaxID=166010 RepID=A0AAD4MY32_9BILA|nr:acyltransferase domain-containing protein [Ditylenchus destructor]
MFALFFTIYLTSLVAGYAATLLLILTGMGWRSLPRIYLQMVLFLQSFFPKDAVVLEQIIDRDPNIHFEVYQSRPNKTGDSTTSESRPASPISNYSNSGYNSDSEGGISAATCLFEVNIQLARVGVEAIIQDEVLDAFGQAPMHKIEEPVSLRRRFAAAVKNLCSNSQRKVSMLGSTLLLALFLFIRWFVLFPVRLALMLTSFVFLAVCCILACVIDFSGNTKTKIALIYCRLFNAGSGLIANYHNPENRPTRPGVAVANHLSPNDIQIICADVNPKQNYIYSVTGQKHQGIIWTIERLVERLCPSIWLERASADERRAFTKAVLHEARTSGPVLIFPEGYCTNNTKVLQFRRAVFEEDVNIHPIAVRQDARFGDSYWSEDQFFHYLLRVLTSWAIVYDVYYLPVQRRYRHEDATEFARRVQCLIAEAADCAPAGYDGGVFYKQHEKHKHLRTAQQRCAYQLLNVNGPEFVISEGPILEKEIPTEELFPLEGPSSLEDTIPVSSTVTPFPAADADYVGGSTTASSTSSFSRISSNGYSNLSHSEKGDDENESDGMEEPTQIQDVSKNLQVSDGEDTDGSLLNG